MASIMDGERQFHINTLPGEVGRYVILPGDPGRVPTIAKLLDDPKQIAYNREFNVFTGTLCGEKVTVCSTGIGGPSAAIAVEELIKCGADTFIRIGTSGGMDLSVSGGDLVIASAAVRGEGTSYEYLPKDYPCVASFDVIDALRRAAQMSSSDDTGNRYHIGVVHSKDSFYGEVEPQASPMSADIMDRWEAYMRSGCLASEMETSAVYAVCTAHRKRCGAVFTALWNVERSKQGLEDNITYDSTRAIKCAVDAIRLLIEQDSGKE